jgi:hypothetical protein
MKPEMNMTNNKDTTDLKAFSIIVEALSPLDPADRTRLLETISHFFGLPSPGQSHASTPSHAASFSAPHHGALVREGPFSTDRSDSPKQFLLEKQPKTDVERVACLAYYLTHFREIPHFRTLEISKLNTEAAQPKFSNAHYSLQNAMAMGYLAAATKGNKQISAAGERFVQLLPDREAARAAMNSLRNRRVKRDSAKSRKTSAPKE